MPYPVTRLRRLRINPLVRSQIQETELSARRLVAPLFVRAGRKLRAPIASMPGQYQFSLDELIVEAKELKRHGIGSLLLFGIPAHKDAGASQAYASTGIVQEALAALKKAAPNMLLIADLCFCEYTTHGHCGIIKNGDVDNDATLLLIAITAGAQARAGADIIAPSGMMDGMVRTIRQALDNDGFKNTPIMSY